MSNIKEDLDALEKAADIADDTAEKEEEAAGIDEITGEIKDTTDDIVLEPEAEANEGVEVLERVNTTDYKSFGSSQSLGKKLQRLVVATLCMLLIIIAFGTIVRIIGDNMNSKVTNPMKQYETLAEVPADFEYMVPSTIAERKDAKYFSFGDGEMVNIQGEDFDFRAAKHIADNVDISGQYGEFSVEKYYKSKVEFGDAELRYRTNGDMSVISMTESGIDYSLAVKGDKTEQEVFEAFGIDINMLEEVSKDAEKAEDLPLLMDSSSEGTETSSDVVDAETDEPKDKDVILYTPVSNLEMGVEFLLPVLETEVRQVYSENQLAVLLGNNLAFVIEYYEEGYEGKEFVGFTTVGLDDKHLMRYTDLSEEIKADEKLYRDYTILMDSMDNIRDTFEVLDKTK